MHPLNPKRPRPDDLRGLLRQRPFADPATQRRQHGERQEDDRARGGKLVLRPYISSFGSFRVTEMDDPDYRAMLDSASPSTNNQGYDAPLESSADRTPFPSGDIFNIQTMLYKLEQPLLGRQVMAFAFDMGLGWTVTGDPVPPFEPSPNMRTDFYVYADTDVDMSDVAWEDRSGWTQLGTTATFLNLTITASTEDSVATGISSTLTGDNASMGLWFEPSAALDNTAIGMVEIYVQVSCSDQAEASGSYNTKITNPRIYRAG